MLSFGRMIARSARPSASRFRSFSSRVAAAPASKVFASAAEALKQSGLKDGDKLLAGGFGLSGIPMTTIRAIDALGVKNLTVVSNNCGTDNWGLGILLNNRRIKRMVASYVGENAEFERQYLKGELEVELTPQGTLAEKLRAGGAGIPAFYTPTAAGTILQKGGFEIKYKLGGAVAEIVSKPKEVRLFGGKEYVLEDSITGDVAIVKAWRADKYGNLQFRGTAQNFNPDVASAGRYTIAEVDEIVEVGAIPPESVHVSGGYIQAVVKTDEPKKIEKRTVVKRSGAEPEKKDLFRDKVARRAALELTAGMKVNLGIGIPTEIPKFLDPAMQVMIQSENGLLGMGSFPFEGEEDADWINAGKQTVTPAPGASLFSSSQSFGMIRGRHIDLTVLGGMEVAANGDLANWIIPGKMVKGMGGAMDLVSSGTRVIVIMEHVNKKGEHKVLKACNLPLTGRAVVDMIITDLAVFSVDKARGRLVLLEKVDEISLDELRKKTGCDFDATNVATYRQ